MDKNELIKNINSDNNGEMENDIDLEIIELED